MDHNFHGFGTDLDVVRKRFNTGVKIKLKHP
jgi:hypothetical protein